MHDPDKTPAFSDLAMAFHVQERELEAAKCEEEQGLKPPHKTPSTFPKRKVVIVGLP